MTTPQPAALPELPEPSLQQGKYGYRLSHEDYYTADQMRARDAMWAERLAALQPQPDGTQACARTTTAGWLCGLQPALMHDTRSAAGSASNGAKHDH